MDVYGSAVIQSSAHSSGDVFLPEVLVLQFRQLLPDSLEWSFWILKGGHVHVVPMRFFVWFGFVTRLRRGRFFGITMVAPTGGSGTAGSLDSLILAFVILTFRPNL